MPLVDIISEDRIKLDIADADKWTVIEDLVDLVVRSGKGTDREAILKAVLDREAQGSTGLERGIAVPHARASGLADLVGALGVSRQGIDFESSDGKPCHLVFLIVAPPQSSAKYLKALSAVAFIARDAEIVNKLKTARSPGEVAAIFADLSGQNH